MAKHKREKCPYCNYSTTDKSQLHQHVEKCKNRK